ncbi:DUF5701 family protein [Streptomyces roseoverticillatus]|uniref:DUF5701 family protein n=1 Tax=Streptomyces roseoverticillatus TaxID=66429 RepID=A0ABV3J498_9ACTN
MTTTETAFDDAGAEFDRQVRTLTALGYPALAGLAPEEFDALVAPLRAEVVAHAATAAAAGGREPCCPEGGRVPFLLVVPRNLAPIEETMPRTVLHGGNRPGFVDRSFEPGSLERFVATRETGLPHDQGAGPYLLFGIERGEEFCGAVPHEAMDTISGRGRTLLTIEEGIALVTLFPRILVKNKCFSLGGSRSGDRRVPALWISQKAPKLGWCWQGNPHTWLGMASAGARSAAATKPQQAQ